MKKPLRLLLIIVAGVMVVAACFGIQELRLALAKDALLTILEDTTAWSHDAAAQEAKAIHLVTMHPRLARARFEINVSYESWGNYAARLSRGDIRWREKSVGCDIWGGYENTTFLHHARTIPLAEALVAHGADINAQDATGITPLTMATSDCGGDSHLPQWLIDHGANVNMSTTEGMTALHFAAWSGWRRLGGNAKAVDCLLKAGADCNAADDCGRTPLYYFSLATSNSTEEVISGLRTLLAARPDVNAVDRFGRTALFSAAEEGFSEMVQILLDSGADINKSDSHGTTPLMAVIAHGEDRQRMAAFMVSHGADIGVCDVYGQTALHVAAWTNSPEIVKMLIASGGQVNARMADGRTPLDLAEEDEIIQVLREAGGKSGIELDGAEEIHIEHIPPAPR